MRIAIIMILISLFSFCFQCKDAGQVDNEKLASPWSDRKEDDPFPDFSMPAYPGVSDVEYSFDRHARIKQMSYDMEIRYPAYDLIYFYDKKLAENRWRVLKNKEFGKAEWFEYVDETREGSPYIVSYRKLWIDKNDMKQFLLALNYKREPSADWNDRLYVISQIFPYYDDSALMKFRSKMQNERKWDNIVSLLARYKKDDLTIDFEMALRENPGNKDLAEYIQIYKEIEQKINEAK